MHSLGLGCVFSDRIEALLDGRVQLEGYDLHIRICQAQALFKDVLGAQTYDLAEMSLGAYISAMASGQTHYVGLPIFLSRAFRHSNIYIRGDVGISSPHDLAGKCIGIMDYTQTAGIWVRGLLADEYNLSRQSVRWVTGGLFAPLAEDRMSLRLPAEIHIERTQDTLDHLLRSGQIDAIISPQAPQCFRDGHPEIRRLFVNYCADEKAYFLRTGIFPIMHCVVARSALLDADSHLADHLFAAFTKAKALAQADLAYRDYAKTMLPWLPQHAHDVTAVLGEDVWSYGTGPNLRALETFMRYCRADGLCSSEFRPDQVFR